MYELSTSRPGWTGLLGAEEDRLDRVEVVCIDDGEVVLFWELPSRMAGKLLRLLRADLAGMDAAEFFDKWQGADAAFDE